MYTSSGRGWPTGSFVASPVDWSAPFPRRFRVFHILHLLEDE